VDAVAEVLEGKVLVAGAEVFEMGVSDADASSKRDGLEGAASGTGALGAFGGVFDEDAAGG
jgi:hypothetical protein